MGGGWGKEEMAKKVTAGAVAGRGGGNYVLIALVTQHATTCSFGQQPKLPTAKLQPLRCKSQQSLSLSAHASSCSAPPPAPQHSREAIGHLEPELCLGPHGARHTAPCSKNIVIKHAVEAEAAREAVFGGGSCWVLSVPVPVGCSGCEWSWVSEGHNAEPV